MTTRITCLTPPGSAPIAVIGLRGPEAWSIVQRLFRPASGRPLPDEPKEHATWFGRIGDGVGDEVIVSVLSLQPEPFIEIHCHGGRQVVSWLIESLRREGCIEVAPEQILAVNDAWALLPHAKTLRTASILLDQANGVFNCAIASIQQALSENRTDDAHRLLHELRRYESVGRHLVEPWRVAIAGAPNAGKSSLLNALAGYQRSVVAPIPGTTRDVVTATLAFDGWPVEIADTAGLREGGDELESEGIARARRQLAAADLCLWVIDTTEPLPSSLERFARENGIDRERVLPILNKIDQPPAWNLTLFTEASRLSATTGDGLDVLIRRITEMLVPDSPLPETAIPSSQEDRQRIVVLQAQCK